MSDGSPLVEVLDLDLAYRHQDDWLRVLHGVSFTIGHGETFGLVGESGCGKSTVAYQLLGYRRPNARVEGGAVLFEGRDMLRLSRPELDRLRGNRIALVPQNPTTALSPGMRVGEQITEVLLLHGAASDGAAAGRRAVELFRLVGLPASERIDRRYPHQLSGGQQQRVIIAMALACDPALVVLDEPTTGLDVTTQAQILELLRDLRRRLGMSMLYVTHDLGVLAEIADRVGVMYAGRMVEVAPTAALFGNPRHPYTRGLIASLPRVDEAGPRGRPLRGLLRRDELPAGCPFQPRCDAAEPSCAITMQRLEAVDPGHEVACQRWHRLDAPASEPARDGTRLAPPLGEAPVLAVEGIDLRYDATASWGRWFAPPAPPVVSGLGFAIAAGETFALVGESGSGKSTIARAISGMIAPAAGRILFEGRPLPGLVRARTTDQRRRIQYIFQNPDASLNPRARVGSILGRPLDLFGAASGAMVAEGVARALDEVRLDAGYATRFPDQLSGGERQRVAIARALIANPTLLLCDEILSALDVSVQASIIELLRRLRLELRLTLLFISHDLAVVRHLADRVGVLYRGRLMEVGRVADIFAPPFHPYTHSLLMAVPGVRKEADRAALGPAPSGAPGKGCVFAGRCPWQAGPQCENEPPPWRTTETGLQIRCHIPLDGLAQRAAWRSPAANREVILQ